MNSGKETNAQDKSVDKGKNANNQIIGKRVDEQILVAPGYGINIEDKTEENHETQSELNPNSQKGQTKMDEDVFLNEVFGSDEITDEEGKREENVEAKLVELTPSIILEVSPNDENTALFINMCSPIVLSDEKLKEIHERTKNDNPNVSLDALTLSQYNLPRYFFYHREEWLRSCRRCMWGSYGRTS